MMSGHRFELGERVTHCEKGFPNGVRSTEMVVVEQLTGAGEPKYQLRVYDGLAECVLAESQLSSPPDSHEPKWRLEALGPGEPSPWTA